MFVFDKGRSPWLVSMSRFLQKPVGVWALAFALSSGVSTWAAQNQHKSKGEVDEPVYEIDKDTIPPRVTKQVDPKYTGSRGFRVEGTVSLRAVVSSRGLPSEVQIIKGLGPEVDESAVEAVKQWRFEPAKKNGKALAVRVAVDIRFHTM